MRQRYPTRTPHWQLKSRRDETQLIRPPMIHGATDTASMIDFVGAGDALDRLCLAARLPN